jgi:Domain of unknown function (DUF4340)
MKLKLQTIVLVVAALLSAIGLYFWDKNRTPAPSSVAQKTTGSPLFTVQEADITQLDIQSKQNPITMERQPNGWKITAPKPGPADEATVAFLLNLLATGRSERSLSADASQLQQFGLDQPVATLSLKLKNGQAHQIQLGTQNFDQSSIYARVDPGAAPAASAKIPVVLLPTNFLNAIQRPLSDWQVKPKTPASSSASPDGATSPTSSTTPTTSPAGATPIEPLQP